MIFRPIVGILVLLIVCSCNQQISKSGLSSETSSNQQPSSNSGLRIENGINRGTGYADSKGIEYNIRYIPVTITNERTVPTHLQIAFSKEYDYPSVFGDEQFKVILMPKVFIQDGVKLTAEGEMLTDSMEIEFRNYVGKDKDDPYFLKETLEPGKELELAIGTQYLMHQESFVLPFALFVNGDGTNFHACDKLIDKDESSDSQFTFGLKLDINRGASNESCMIIPCGQITYIEH